MMTTMAALLGALPLALATGTGSELRNPLGVSIVGGLLAEPAHHALHDAGDHTSRWSASATASSAEVKQIDPDAEVPEEYEHRRAAE